MNNSKCKLESDKLRSCWIGYNIEGFWYRAECRDLKQELIRCLDGKKNNTINNTENNKNK